MSLWQRQHGSKGKALEPEQKAESSHPSRKYEVVRERKVGPQIQYLPPSSVLHQSTCTTGKDVPYTFLG